MNYELLSKPLFRLEPTDLDEIRQVADRLFARLCRPFQQQTVARQFSYKKTLRSAERTGHFLPAYEKVARRSPKSRLVIAMSLSGIDRCYAVGLIPLLAQLRHNLDFKLFLYTDDVVEARFTEDGFLENDTDIAWNNSNWVNLFARLGQIDFDKQEDHLLLIDSLGAGGDSTWYNWWSRQTQKEVQQAQLEYMGEPWGSMREELAGRYREFDSVFKDRLPAEWQEFVLRNTKTRWVDAPAMREYLIRWLFHPQFGRVQHSTFYPSTLGAYRYMSDVLPMIADKFATVHLLTPCCTETTRSNLRHTLLPMNFIDFHHAADTLEGIAQVMVNMVFRRETNRLRVPEIKFGTYVVVKREAEEEVEVEEEHTEYVKGSKCFRDCGNYDLLPETKWCLPRRKKGQYDVSDQWVPFNEIDIDKSIDRLVNQVEPLVIRPDWTDFSRRQAAEEWLNYVTNHEFVPKTYSNADVKGIELVEREYDEGTLAQVKSWLEGVEFEKHRTRALKIHLFNWLSFVSKRYIDYMVKVPLKHMVWCTLSMFSADRLAVSVRPVQDRDDQFRLVMHEASHYLAYACPAINVFTNQVLRIRSGTNGESDINKLIPVGEGEYALPAKPGVKPWRMKYAGKWYKRKHRHLCNDDEILTCYMEEFRSADTVLKLCEYDEWMCRFVAFVVMGGPLAYLQSMTDFSRGHAMFEVEQARRRQDEAAALIRQKAEKREAKKRGVVVEVKKVKPEPPPQLPTPKERNKFGL